MDANSPIKPPRGVPLWQRWWIEFPVVLIVAWYAIVLFLLPELPNRSLSIVDLVRANLRGYVEMPPANVKQATCLVNQIWGAQNTLYKMTVEPTKTGYRIVATPDRQWYYSDGWLHGVLFLKRRHQELPTFALDMPEAVMTTVQKSPPRTESYPIKRKSTDDQNWCDVPNYADWYHECCAL